MNYYIIVYNNILHYFIHFYFITFFEILFYKYYIFTYEQEILYDLIASTFNDNANYKFNLINITKNSIQNMTLFTENCNDIIENNENEINDNNNYLFYICDIYLYTISTCLCLFLFCDFYLTYQSFIQKILNNNKEEYLTNENNETLNYVITPMKISNSPKNNEGLRSTSQNSIGLMCSHISPIEMVSDEKEIYKNKKTTCNFAYYYVCNSMFINEINKVVIFILILGTFEYLFFTFIVCKFRFLNIAQMICSIINNKIK